MAVMMTAFYLVTLAVFLVDTVESTSAWVTVLKMVAILEEKKAALFEMLISCF